MMSFLMWKLDRDGADIKEVPDPAPLTFFDQQLSSRGVNIEVVPALCLAGYSRQVKNRVTGRKVTNIRLNVGNVTLEKLEQLRGRPCSLSSAEAMDILKPIGFNHPKKAATDESSGAGNK